MTHQRESTDVLAVGRLDKGEVRGPGRVTSSEPESVCPPRVDSSVLFVFLWLQGFLEIDGKVAKRCTSHP